MRLISGLGKMLCGRSGKRQVIMAYMVCILYIFILVDWANIFTLTVMDILVATQATATILLVGIVRTLTMSNEAMTFCRHCPSSLDLSEPSEVTQADLHKVSAGSERGRDKVER